ncbi:MAG TPA: aspartyl protease family protein [Flavobacteriales bacterium]|jgi:predicted aspartyl protease|nr:aspartyl protease family protein [Flavobacteriales bacterium]HOZ40191.1 aspartyl protease family protein [Flavobacteriales bacterium]
MKKSIALFSVLMVLHGGCGFGRKLVNGGEVVMQARTERVALEIKNDLLFCQVTIEGRPYTFILDTGAPTVISMELYEALGLKEERALKVVDSQKNKAKQIISVIPSLRLGNMEFRNIACVAIDLKAMSTACFGIDGFIGANLLSELIWQFDYANKEAIASRDITAFGVDTFDLALAFHEDNKKTPKVNGEVNGRKLSFTFDTGSSGHVSVFNDYAHHMEATNGERFITSYGSGALGIYGAAANERMFTMKQAVTLDGRTFEHQLIEGGKSNLLGNRFLKDHLFVLDWSTRRVYLDRRPSAAPQVMEGFGMWYRFEEGRARVVEVVEGRSIPVQVGDEVLRIDTTDLVGPSAEDVCRYQLNKVERDKDRIHMRLVRGSDTLEVDLERQVFIE